MTDWHLISLIAPEGERPGEEEIKKAVLEFLRITVGEAVKEAEIATTPGFIYDSEEGNIFTAVRLVGGIAQIATPLVLPPDIPKTDPGEKVVFCPVEAVKKAVDDIAKEEGNVKKTRSQWLRAGLLRWLSPSGPVKDDSIYTYQNDKKTEYTAEEMSADLDITLDCITPAQALWAVLSEDGSVIKDYRIGPIV